MMNEPKIYRTKDISKLKQKSELTGDEKLPVSKDAYITVGQIMDKVEDDLSETLQNCVKKTDHLVIGSSSPADLVD